MSITSKRANKKNGIFVAKIRSIIFSSQGFPICLILTVLAVLFVIFRMSSVEMDYNRLSVAKKIDKALLDNNYNVAFCFYAYDKAYFQFSFLICYLYEFSFNYDFFYWFDIASFSSSISYFSFLIYCLDSVNYFYFLPHSLYTFRYYTQI